MESNEKAIISMERYNYLLNLEEKISKLGGHNAIWMATNRFGWHNSDINIFNRDETVDRLICELKTAQSENKELVESLRDILRDKPSVKEKFNIFSKIPTSWLNIRR